MTMNLTQDARIAYNARLREQLHPGQTMAFRCECDADRCREVVYLATQEYDRRHSEDDVRPKQHAMVA